MGLRTLMGHREITPTNILLAETKVMRLKERAGYLARNCLIKILSYGKEELKKKLNKLEVSETRYRIRCPRRAEITIVEAWKRVKRDREIIFQGERHEVLEANYWTLTEQINADFEEERRRKEGSCTDSEMIESIKRKYGMKRNAQVIYTDGSKREGAEAGRVISLLR